MPAQTSSTAVTDPTDPSASTRSAAGDHSGANAESGLRALQTAVQTIGAARSTQAVFDALRRSATDATGTSVAIVSADAGGPFSVVAGAHPYAELLTLPIVLPETTAHAGQEPVHLSDRAAAEVEYPDVARALGGAGIESITAVAIPGEGRRAALLCASSRPRTAEESGATLLGALADLAGQALRRLQLEEELQRDSLHDALTGLMNAEPFTERLVQALAASGRARRPLALISIGIDDFGRINGTLSPGIGDAVLRQVARRLRSAVRPSDTLARTGGDVFSILCEEIDVDAADQLGRRLHETIRLPFDGVPSGLTLTASIGVAAHDGSGGVAARLLSRAADAALSRSKEHGKNRVTTVTV